MSTPTPFPALDGLSERDQRAALADFFAAEQARLGLRPSEDFDRLLGELRTGVKCETPPAPVSAPANHPLPWEWGWDGLEDAAGTPLVFLETESLPDSLADHAERIVCSSPYVQAVTAAAPLMEALLRRLEFYTYDDDGCAVTVCPICDADTFLPHERQPGYAWHREGCELATLLAGIDRAKAGG